MESFIDTLKKSNNELLKNESEGIELLRSLRHNASDLKVFLANTVAEIRLRSGETLICTSNNELVQKFSKAKPVGGTPDANKTKIFQNESRNFALTWDLMKNKYASVAGNDWQIMNFIVIRSENVEILHRTINELLKEKP